jgi:hypothetical protein
MFDRVVLINLNSRPDRLEAFKKRQQQTGWPLPDPEVYPAIHGDTVGVPGYWLSGGGAWGCCRSHVNVLERAVMDRVGSVLVLEDDLIWRPDLGARLAEFMAAVPGDWDQLMLGGQHYQSNPRPVAPGVVKCGDGRGTHRTHAYVVRGEAMKSLLALWYRTNRHVDHVMGPWQKGWNVYAPDPFLFGQGPGKSDISGRDDTIRYWSSAPAAQPVVYLDAPKGVVRELRDRHRLHTGHWRCPDTDLDWGLIEITKSKYPCAGLRRWVERVGWEAMTEGRVLAVWHPDIPLESLRIAHDGPVVEVRADTVEDCLRGLEAAY